VHSLAFCHSKYGLVIAQMLEPRSVLDALTSREPVALEMLPNEHGVYALYDHTGQVRYFGVTTADKIGFRNRINSRHVTGSEGRSHKFSHAYNTGRMWRNRAKRTLEDMRDAKIAKDLRTIFCRRYCRATYYSVPVSSVARDYFGELTALEMQIQSIASPSMRRWERLHFVAEDEPKEMVDALIDELGYSSELRRALERQAELFARRALCNS
jgi:hypothetical protein